MPARHGARRDQDLNHSPEWWVVDRGKVGEHELEQESNDPFLSMFVVCGGIIRGEDDRRSPEGNVLCRWNESHPRQKFVQALSHANLP